MLEIGILVTVSLIIFLLLRNFPIPNREEEDLVNSGNNLKNRRKDTMIKIWDKLVSKRRRESERKIKEAIVGDQKELVSPKEIEDAKDSFFTSDPEIAKLLHEASQALEKGEVREVEKKSLKVLSKDKRSDQAYVFIAEVALHKKNYQEAVEAADTALKCNRRNANARAILGKVYFLEEKYSESISNYQKAVNADRNQASWQAGLGKAYLEVRQFSKATKALKRAASLDIDNKEYKQLASEAEDKQRDHARAFRKR